MVQWFGTQGGGLSAIASHTARHGVAEIELIASSSYKDTMHRTRRSTTLLLATAALGITLLVQGCASPGGNEGHSWPDGPLDYVIPYNPGGSSDPVGREFSRLLAEELGTTAIVENLPGGDETIGITAVVRAEANGMTLGLSSAAGIIVQPLVNSSLPWQGVDGYTPVVKMAVAPNAIFVGKDSPFSTIEDLIVAAKERPGEITVGTTGRLTNNTFTLIALEQQAGIDLNIVPFSGGAGEAILATMGGQIDAAIPTAAGQLGLVQSGDIRALAHTGDSRYDEILPGSVSFASLGYDIPFDDHKFTVAAPGLDDAVRERLVAAAYAVASGPEWAAWCAKNGLLADPLQGQELMDYIALVTEASRQAIALVE